MTSTDFDEYNRRLLRSCVFTAPFNLTGQPAISLPLYQTDDGNPLGVQFVGRLGEEATLLGLAGQLETVLPWKDRKPAIFDS